MANASQELINLTERIAPERLDGQPAQPDEMILKFDGYYPDEPLFIIRGRDALADWMVRLWVMLAQGLNAGEEKITEAAEFVETMKVWPVKQVAGRDGTRIIVRDTAASHFAFNGVGSIVSGPETIRMIMVLMKLIDDSLKAGLWDGRSDNIDEINGLAARLTHLAGELADGLRAAADRIERTQIDEACSAWSEGASNRSVNEAFHAGVMHERKGGDA